MKILYTGLPYFSRNLVAELNKFDKKNHYVFCDTYTSKWAQVKFVLHLFSTDLVVSFNGVSSRSRSLDFALKFKKKIMIQWQGTDVLMVEKNKQNGIFTDKYLNNSKSFTDATWLQDELKEMNIESDILHFKHVVTSTQQKKFEKIQVLTYVLQDKEVFYGLDEIRKLAEANPSIQFNVMGTDGNGIDSPANINYLGWIPQKEACEWRDKCPIFIRLTEHDGYSLSVMEALANGNYVLWNYPHEQCTVVTGNKNIKEAFEEIIEEINQNNLSRNQKNIDWCNKNRNRNVILSKYIHKLKEYVHS